MGQSPRYPSLNIQNASKTYPISRFWPTSSKHTKEGHSSMPPVWRAEEPNDAGLQHRQICILLKPPTCWLHFFCPSEQNGQTPWLYCKVPVNLIQGWRLVWAGFPWHYAMQRMWLYPIQHDSTWQCDWGHAPRLKRGGSHWFADLGGK